MKPRERARAQTIEDIKSLARTQLAEVSPADLSLRAIARELGIVSSGIYRYVESRDELLTMLIAEGYGRLGEAVEAADGARRRRDHRGRWLAIGRAVRTWALDHPSEYALLYGTPVPGYAAPPEITVEPAQRVPAVLVRLLTDAWAAGAVADRPATSLPRAVRADLETIASALDSDVPVGVLARGVMVWTAMFGAVSFEVFGQLNNVFADKAAWYDHQLHALADTIGL